MPKLYHSPGDILYSPGFTEAYEVVSYPVCRLYYSLDPKAQYPLQPHSFEQNPNKKEKDFVSYLVRLLGRNHEPFYITDQCLKRE